jgi:hypothetical protein
VPEIHITVDGEEMFDPIDVPEDGDFHTIQLTIEPDGESVRVEADGVEVFLSPRL